MTTVSKIDSAFFRWCGRLRYPLEPFSIYTALSKMTFSTAAQVEKLFHSLLLVFFDSFLVLVIFRHRQYMAIAFWGRVGIGTYEK